MSLSTTKKLQNFLLSRYIIVFPGHRFDLCLCDWCKNNQPIQSFNDMLSTKQNSWAQPVISKKHALKPDDHNRARLLAASAILSSYCLKAQPISFCNLRLDDEAVRVAVGLRLGTNVCDQYRSHCSTVFDCRGTIGLLCKRSSARMAWHSYINDNIHCVLARTKSQLVFLVLM